MKKQTESLIKANLLLLSVGVVVFGGIVGCGTNEDKQRLAGMTAEAPAEVLSVDVISDKSNTKRRIRNNSNRRRTRTTHETVVDYRFAASGGMIEATTEKSGDVHQNFKVGMAAKACYNPSQPDESEVFPANHQCGK